MNFFEHQDRARQKTWRLIALLGLSVVLIILAINIVVHFFLFTLRDTGRPSHSSYMPSQMSRSGPAAQAGIRERIGTYATVSGVALLLIGLTSGYRIMQLRSSGGDRIATDLGGVWVDPVSADPKLQRLCNVVEEMALASGVPIPHVYVLGQEKSINALAAGYSFEDAVIVVSQGALDRLNRDELQGVVGHEFTHILNGDMRLNIRMIGLLFGILAISEVGRFLLYGSSRGRGGGKGAGVMAFLGLILWCLGYIGVFFGRLIRAGVSRQREFLADASAVQFTRNPAGIAGALKKIGGFTDTSHVHMPRREEVSHMFFAEGQSFWLKMMATHPPLLERIRAIEPDFQPADFATYAKSAPAYPEMAGTAGVSAFTGQTEAAWKSGSMARASGKPDQRDKKQADSKQVGSSEADTRISVARLADALETDAASPDPKRLEQATALLYTIPEPLLNAARRQEEVETLLLALLLGMETSRQDRKMLLIWDTLGDEAGGRVKKLLRRTGLLSPSLCIPLVDLAAPTLRNLPPETRKRLVELVEELLNLSGGKTSLLGYCFVRLLKQRIRDMDEPAQVGGAGKGQPAYLRQSLIRIFSVLAMHGHVSTTLAGEAFQRGVIRLLPESTPVYVKPDDWISDMDNALTVLDQLNFRMKDQLIQALLATASFDGKLSLEEIELLRLICACLHAPVPPVLPSAPRQTHKRAA